ncbi:rRNA maturation RNase YbeY, partial [Candidatus Uhrbacteria bacterium]|nr:rRNA maturation RNase YbeY [Candidatus Uhrbacteria bacterium]
GEREGVEGAISIAFIGPKRMREINREYHGEDRVTDVLAFSAPLVISSGAAAKSRDLRSVGDFSARRGLGRNDEDLGEIIICPPYVRAYATRSGEPFRRALARVLIHGMLHLLGYDHAKPRDAARMFALQEDILGTV